MTSRFFTYLVLVLGLLSSSLSLKAQQVTFTLTPATVTPNVGDTVRLDVVLNNFTNMTSFQYATDWDPNLFDYIGIAKGKNMVDTTNLGVNNYTLGAMIVAWSANGADKTVPNGTVAYTLILKAKAASTNFWVRFTSDGTSIEVIKAGSSVNPAFGNVGNPPGSTNSPVTVKSSTHSIQASQSVCVGITADNFSNMTSAKWSMKWDSTVLRYDSLTKLNTTLNLTRATNFVVTDAVAKGRLSFSWNSGTATTVTTGDTLYKICFTALSAAGTSTTVSTLTAGSELFRISGGVSVTATLNPNNGTVSITNPAASTNVTILANKVAGNVGDTVCVKVFVKNFKNIGTATWSMHWDSSKMSLVQARVLHGVGPQDALVLPNPLVGTSFTTSNNLLTFNTSLTGSLRYYAGLFDNPVNFTADSTLVLDVCLKLNSGAGTTSPFTIDGFPLKVLVSDFEANKLTPIILIPGSITINNVAVPAIVASGTATNLNCNGGSDGKVDLTVSGGTGTFTYAWTGPSFTATTKDITGLKAGKYYVTISSGSATPKVDSFTLTEPTKLTTTKTSTNVNCFGQSTGSVTLTPAGGTSPYTYLWSSAETTIGISNKAAGQYIVSITDSKSCVLKDTTTITQPAAALTVSPSVTNITCNGASTGAIALTVAGGTTAYTYVWSGPNNYTAATKDIASLKAGAYTVTVTDSKGCAQTSGPTNVAEATAITVTPSVTAASCGQSNGAIAITVVGGTSTPAYTYKWTGPGTYTSTSKDITGLATGSYTVEVTDGAGCKMTSTAIPVSNANPSFTVTNSVTNVACNGETNGAVALTVTGGSGAFTYAWTGAITATTKDISNLKAGAYSVAVTETSTGCQVVSAATVTQPNALTLGASQKTDIVCKGASTGTITVTANGGNGTNVFTWTGPNGYMGSGSTIANLAAGVYTVVVKDAKLCSATTTVTITEPATAVAIGNPSVTNVLCNGASTGAIVIAVQGGATPYTYLWNGGSTQQNQSNIAAGTYTVTATDANGCKATATATVTQPTAISINGTTSNTVVGCVGTITLNVTGGTGAYTYTWTGNGITPAKANNQNQTDLCPNETYTVTVKDANNCTATKSFTITGTIAPPIRLTDSTVVSPAGCPGQNLGAINITFTGGQAPFSFEWLNAAGEIIDRRQNQTGLITGKYRVRITDAIGQKYLSGEIDVKGSTSAINIGVSRISSETCNGNDGEIILNITGGAAPYKYVWNDGPTSKDRLGIKAGTYSVTVSDENSCFSDKKDIKVDKSFCPLNATASAKAANCFSDANGSITVNITNGEPGYTIKWSATDSINVSNAPSRTASYEIRGLTAGTYNVSIIDSKGQRLTINTIVTQPSEIIINKTVKNDAGNCSGSIVLAISGGQAPYSYIWNDGGTSRDRFNLCSNTILSVQVTDSKGCFKSTANDTIKASVEPSTCATVRINTLFDNLYNIKCFNDKNASATVTTVTDLGLTPPFQYRWDNGETGPTASQLAAGSRTVTVIGANGRTCNSSITIKGPDEIKATVIPFSVDCAIEANVKGGVEPYSYKWSTPKGDTTKRVSNVATKTTFYVVVADKYKCTTDPGVGMVVCTDECLKGPTVLTPNDDGKNDKFIIERCDYKNVRFQVFNRWGQLVYENSNYLDQWEGYSRDGRDGKEVPEGVYMYVLRAFKANGLEQVEKNTVTILRQ